MKQEHEAFPSLAEESKEVSSLVDPQAEEPVPKPSTQGGGRKGKKGRAKAQAGETLKVGFF